MRTFEAGARKKILDAAEALVVQAGFDGVVLAAVAARAGVGEAAVRRAFGSASGLARAVFARRLDPLDEERLRLLRCAESLRPGGRAFVESVLRAYLVPWIRFWQTSRPLLALYARHTTPPPRPLEKEVAERFTAALARALPGMSPLTLAWRLHFISGAILRLWADPEEATRRSGGLCTFDDIEAVVGHLVTFAAAALEPGHHGIAKTVRSASPQPSPTTLPIIARGGAARPLRGHPSS